MNVPEAWTVEKLPGKSEHYLYYTGDTIILKENIII